MHKHKYQDQQNVKVSPMEDDVAPDALVEEGSHHVEEDVEDPEEVHDKSS